MTAVDTSAGEVRITLKDVYQQTQSLEKSLSGSLGTLNLTMVAIQGHLGQLDTRNAAADQLNKEHGDRLTAAERILVAADLPVAMRDYEVRVRSLERFKWALMGALVLANGAAFIIEYLLTHKGG